MWRRYVGGLTIKNLNAGKTKAIIIGSGAYINRLVEAPPIKIRNITINYSDTVKSLGVVFDNTLSWKAHVLEVSNKVYKNLYQFKRIRECLPFKIRQMVVSSLILPHFDYCCLVYNDLSGERGLALERVLNSCIRFIFGIPIRQHVTPYYNKLGWLKLKSRRKYFLGCYVFNLLMSKRPSYLYRDLTFKISFRSRSLRASPLDLQMPIHRTTTFDRSFSVESVRVWNGIPERVRRSRSLAAFKAQYYQYLIGEQRGSVG